LSPTASLGGRASGAGAKLGPQMLKDFLRRTLRDHLINRTKEFPMTKKEFGHWLSRSRKSMKLTQEQLAKSLGFQKNDIAAFENGLSAFPAQKVKALAMVLKVDKKFVLELSVVFREEASEKKFRKAA
jgi:DNA-binding XRE family transcriptional regulator